MSNTYQVSLLLLFSALLTVTVVEFVKIHLAFRHHASEYHLGNVTTKSMGR